MDSFELNKILGAVLGTLLLVMSLSIISGAVYAPAEVEKPGFVIEVAEQAPAAGDSAPAAAGDPPIATLMQTASAQTGETIAKKCAACHNFAEGAGAKVGPDLYGVLGRPIGEMQGFKYSAALAKAHADGEKWTYEHLYEFLKKPSAAMPGTAMGFAGLPKPEDRANVIAYLRTLSASPEPLPAAEAAAAPAAPAPAAAAPAADAKSAEPAAAAPAAADAPAAPAAAAPAAPAAPAAEAPAAPAANAPAAAPAAPEPAAPAAPAAPAPANP